MKIRVEQSELSDACSWTTRTLPARPTIPVLAGVRIGAEEGGLHLATFDMETAAKVHVDAVVDEPGTVVVSGRLLADIAKALPKQPVELTLEGSRLSLRCGRSSFGLPTMPVEEYPELPAFPVEAGSLPGSEFGVAIAQVAVAASRDDTLPVLTGIRVELEGDTITMAATDRYRLAVRRLAWSPDDTSISRQVLVKGKQLADLGRTLGEGDSVSLSLGDPESGLIGFSSPDREVVTRLLHGDFPDYRRLLPKDSQTVAETDREELIESVKRVKLVAAERTTPIRLTFSDDEVLLRAGAGDDASASESLECSVSGDPIEIAFNPDYLLDGLQSIPNEKVTLAFTEPRKPAVLSDGPDYQYLLMPMRLGN
ncbi:MAG: DNA polymerase III subunit beta [Actinobacteria bacterium]|nr:DNA polymerase III subunit beta [Actinomycetota bacterium]